MSEVPILFSSGNIAKSAMALGSAEKLGSFVDKLGYDGVEAHPMFRLQHGLGEAAVRGLINVRSLHQTFLTNTASRDTNDYGGNKKSVVDRVLDSRLGRLIGPEVVASASVMGEIQDVYAAHKGKRLPTTFYPQANKNVDREMVATVWPSVALFQPTDHVARLVHTDKTTEEFVATMINGSYPHAPLMYNNRPYDGFAYDLFHARRTYGGQTGVISKESAFNVLLPHIEALHLSVGRVDFAKAEPHIDTMAELDDAITGKFNDFTSNVFERVRATNKLSYVVIEALSGPVAAAGKKRGLSMPETYQQMYQNVRTTLTN